MNTFVKTPICARIVFKKFAPLRTVKIKRPSELLVVIVIVNILSLVGTFLATKLTLQANDLALATSHVELFQNFTNVKSGDD